MFKMHPAGCSARHYTLGVVAAIVVLQCPTRLAANVLYFSGDLRTNATITDCGTGCTLGPSNTDSDYAQWAAVVNTFTVVAPTTMEAVTYSYGGGTSLTGVSVPSGGLEPYLSLFDPSGNFLASTFFGTTCPPGANSVGGNCFDVLLDGGTLAPGTYQIALTAFENMSLAENDGSLNLSDGFSGLGNLAQGENLQYAFDVILPGNVPEPISTVLLGVGCGMLFLGKRISRRTR
ncbi:MAG TPA: DVUA0089 family protein [Bryobacteraceae bacterium]|nr:DVUA0089 family protein [Bryobacteraceae bacterium]